MRFKMLSVKVAAILSRGLNMGHPVCNVSRVATIVVKINDVRVTRALSALNIGGQ